MTFDPGKLIELTGGAADGLIVRVRDGSPVIVAVVKARAHLYHLREDFADRAFAESLRIEQDAESDGAR